VKILIYTDIPPTHAFTAGLVLDRLCRFAPKDTMVCFTAMNEHIDAARPDDLKWLPIYYTRKPNERPPQRFARWRRLNRLWAAVVETYRRRVIGGEILQKAVAFGRQEKIDIVLAVLQGQTIINTALPLAEALGAPLYTLVWDPFSWWVKGHDIDPYTAKLTQRNFDRAVRASRACAVASWAMAEDYRQRYGVRSVPVIASHDAALAQRPPPRLHHEDRVVIGMAGQFYASEEWSQLITALDCADWRIAGKQVFLRTMGGMPPPSKIPPERLNYSGWMPQPDMVRALSECDILYCPYPFSEAMNEVSKLSFPSKLVAYFAAGRPALFNGPLDSSPAHYLAEREAGLCVGTPFASSVYNGLYSLVTQPDLFARLAQNGQHAFEADFTLETMRANFYEFLGIEDDGAVWDGFDEDPVAPLDDRAFPVIGWSPLKWLGKSIAWIPPIPSLNRRIAELEAKIAEMEAWTTVQSDELSSFYRYAIRLLDERAAMEAAPAEPQKADQAADHEMASR
jgi:glycosyltransferase involved in cell wall biosynthesis